MLKKILENIEYFNTDELIQVKKVAELLKIKMDKIRPLLEQIHDDIVEYLGSEKKPAVVISKTECTFLVSDLQHKFMYITNIKLDHIPHVGEIVYFDVVHPYFGGPCYFKVNHISHEISLERHNIIIELRQNVNMYAKWQEEEKEYNENRSFYEDRAESLQHRESFTFKKGTWIIG